jgi:hypothetical protein
MLSYPLCPFFVVFCNVVGTSNAQDFQLLQAVTNGISTLITENKYVNRLHRLCSTLLELCKPLVTIIPPEADMQTSPDVLSGQTAMLPPALNFDIANVAGGSMQADEGTQDGMAPVSSWNDDMMWQLFQSQPSLDWFNADILDPVWDTLPLSK